MYANQERRAANTSASWLEYTMDFSDSAPRIRNVLKHLIQHHHVSACGFVLVKVLNIDMRPTRRYLVFSANKYRWKKLV